MEASAYVLLGACIATFVVVTLLVSRRLRRRARQVRPTGDTVDTLEWAPPETPAPVDRLAYASLETRIAAWVAAVPRAESNAQAEPVSRSTLTPGLVQVNPPQQLLPLDRPEVSPVAAQDRQVAAPGEAVAPTPSASSTPAHVAQVVSGASARSSDAPAAPVELWFDESRVAVRSNSATSDEFQRYANEMLTDLARTRRSRPQRRPSPEE